jgi:glycine/D-amino acid oxidase-like deaminating enzyme/nitrite reductase/ring-hydroxylating ferredoxin subunit
MEHEESASRTLPGQRTSLWLHTTPATRFPPLKEDLRVDAAIIGGGLAGINTAMFLQEAGLTVAIIESDRVGASVTGHTTAKITSLHGTIYDYLITSFGREQATLYAEANQAAMAKYADLIEKKRIACDFLKMPALTYTCSDDDLDEIQEEVEAAQNLGLPASFVDTSTLPFPIRGAIRLEDQAIFHPRKYLLAVVDELTAGGCRIFEETRAVAIETGNIAAIVTTGGRIEAKYVILACHFPFYDPGFFFARMFPKRSYVLGVHVDNALPDGMFYSTETPFHSLRPHPMEDGGFLLVGGEAHKTGHHGSAVDRYRSLEAFARLTFRVKSVAYRWSTQDNVTTDRIPFIGPITPRAENIFVATGFGGWGMTHSMVAAMILSDEILSRDNEWKSLYTPNRVHLRGMSTFLRENLSSAKNMVRDRLTSHEKVDPAKLARGEGGLFSNTKGRRTAMARGDEGDLQALSPECTHMGCLVHWNDGEESWDCPCHGSRFDIEGKVLHGPAIKDLKKSSV